MSVIAPTFSESWHRVASVKASLRPTVQARRQKFRGEDWYVLQDAFNNQFFRLRPAAYEFVARLRPDKSIEEVWLESLERDPENAPGQEETIRLLTQLHYANLLFYDTPSDSEQFFDRYRQRKQRELKSKLMAIMFIRLPLFDPDNILRRAAPYTKYLFTWIAAAVWVAVVGVALKVVLDNFDAALDQAQGVLAPGNLFLLYVGMVFIKSLHEIGHAVTCRHYGGEVHILGVMLLVFTPLPYMDATSSWAFRSRRQRALVGAAGMITELFIAAIAVFVWANTGDGIVHSLAYNMMFVASVSTIIFNANPLLKFDGYYILSDLADLPNLYTRSRRHWAYICEKYLYGVKKGVEVADSDREALWLTIYGALSGVYRVIVFAGIIIFVADKYLLLGLLMVAILVVAWIFVPPYKLIKYLATSPKLDRTRSRAVGVTAGLIVGVLLLTAVIPLPNRFRAPGIVESETHWVVTNESGGVLEEVLVTSGTLVDEGDALVRLSDWEVGNDIEVLRAQLRQVQATQQWATSQRSADLAPLRDRERVIRQQIGDLQELREALTIRARQPGLWVATNLEEQMGAWLPRGAEVGLLYDPERFRFTAVVAQDEAAGLFEDEISRAEVRLSGRAGDNLDITNLNFVPYQSDQLPSAALSWLAGGEIMTARDDESGLRTTEPFFLIRGEIVNPPDFTFFHGQSGRIRLTLESQPLLWQVYRAVRQLIQQRYQI
jgi:putative peptide zinc metalloprotease protein